METINMNTQPDWIEHYKDTLDDYIKFRNEKNKNVSPEESAYGILENSGLLFRYTNDKKYLESLNKLISEDKNLLEDAINYLNNSNIAERTKKVFDIEVINDSGLEEAEDIIAARDEYQAAIDCIRLVAQETIKNNEELKDKFVRAIMKINKVDMIILERPDIARVATRVMEQFIPMIKFEINKNNYWWFYDMREYDKREEEINSDPAWALAETGINPLVLLEDSTSQEETEQSISSKVFERCKDIIEELKGVNKINLEYDFALAAASDKVSPLLVWERPINELKDFFKSSGRIIHSAEVDAPIQQLQSGFNASWYIDSLSIEGNHTHTVYIIANDNCEVLGCADYDSETKTITLDGIINYDRFKKYIDLPKKLLLVLKK